MQDAVRIRQRARALPIFQTTSYVVEDCESAVAYFNLQEYGNTYSRIMNPTVAAFEETGYQTNNHIYPYARIVIELKTGQTDMTIMFKYKELEGACHHDILWTTNMWSI